MPGKERALALCLPRTFETPRELEKPSQTKGVMAPKAKEPVPNTAHGRQRLRRDEPTETPSVKPRPDQEATAASKGLLLWIWCTSDWAKLTLRRSASATRALARAIDRGSRSTATTSPEGPTSRATSIATSPTPEPRSSTR